LDVENKYPTTRTITTTYTYNANGYLDKVEGAGIETGRDYVDDKGFINPYTSRIVVAYDIKLDKPLERYISETITYNEPK
ncbi:MAG: hypothetical protein WCY10_05525, partial [Candidatus Omnitrophota bacterium]